MGRNPEIEAILVAWWELDHCPPRKRTEALILRNELIDKVVVRGDGSAGREDVLDFLWPHYRDYRKDRTKREKIPQGVKEE